MRIRPASILLAIGLGAAGCADIAQYGLTVDERPSYSNPPKLSWAPFSAPEGSGITDVTYEVVVMREEDGTVQINRKGLTSTSFTVERALESGTAYRWSVRPWFTYQGERRVGPWSQRIPKHLQPGQTVVPVPMESFARILISR